MFQPCGAPAACKQLSAEAHTLHSAQNCREQSGERDRYHPPLNSLKGSKTENYFVLISNILKINGNIKVLFGKE